MCVVFFVSPNGHAKWLVNEYIQFKCNWASFHCKGTPDSPQESVDVRMHWEGGNWQCGTIFSRERRVAAAGMGGGARRGARIGCPGKMLGLLQSRSVPSSSIVGILPGWRTKLQEKGAVYQVSQTQKIVGTVQSTNVCEAKWCLSSTFWKHEGFSRLSFSHFWYRRESIPKIFFFHKKDNRAQMINGRCWGDRRIWWESYPRDLQHVCGSCLKRAESKAIERTTQKVSPIDFS